MKSYFHLKIGLFATFSLFSGQMLAATYYVDSTNGDDNNTGLSESNAVRTIGYVNALTLAPGDSLLFRRGQSFDGTLELNTDGVATAPIRTTSWGSGSRPVLYALKIYGDYQIIDNIDIDHQKDATDAVKIRSAKNCILRNMEIRNGTRDAIDLDRSDGLLVEDVEIHHFLNGSYGSKDDSHGLAITNTNGITIRRANIHHVSGDSVQSDPNRLPGGISTNIVIEDSDLWTSPLSEDFNAGWRSGNSPGENAIDTKVLKNGFENEIRMNIVIRNVTAHGWEAVPEISNRAAFNLKEKIYVELDRVTIYDSEIALRIRGSLGNAETRISNVVIYDSGVAIRAEDDLADLRVYNSTFGHGVGRHLEHSGGSGGVPTWDWRNNAFVGQKPNEANHATNILSVDADFVDVGSRNYRLTATSGLIDTGDELARIDHDRDGTTRTAPYDSGAYEFGSPPSRRPNPPVLRID